MTTHWKPSDGPYWRPPTDIPYQRPAQTAPQPPAPPKRPTGWDARKLTSMAAIDARTGRKPRQ